MKKPNPSAFLHELHQELDQKQKRLSFTDDPYFGQRGYDYDPSYAVSCEPLFTAAELLAPYEHGGELHKAVFLALESYGGADTFRDGVLALVRQTLELAQPADPVGVVTGFQLVNKVHRYPAVAWRAEDLPVGTELFSRPPLPANDETEDLLAATSLEAGEIIDNLERQLAERDAELILAKRYLQQALAAHNPRSRLSCDIRRLLGLNPMAPKVGQLTEHGYIINVWGTGVSAHDPATGKTAEVERRKYMSLSVATIAAIRDLKKMIAGEAP